MPTIEQHSIGQCGFLGQLYYPMWFVVHFTGGTPNLPSLYDYWVSQCNIGSNSHFGNERVWTSESQPGSLWQFLQLTGGAAANCCLESGHAPFLPDVNLNVRTISCEGINPDTGNNGDMPQEQFDSYAYLIATVCQEMGIPTDRYTEYWNGYETAHTWGDETGGVIMHRDIAPINRRMCPGTPYYSNQMDSLMEVVRGGNVPSGNIRKRVEPEMVALELNKPVLLVPPPGNSVLEIGVDFADANIRIAGHVEGDTRWEILEINTRPPYDQWYKEIGPAPRWAVDKVSIEVTEFNKSGGVAGASIWPI